MNQTHVRDLAASFARVLPTTSRPSEEKAQGRPGARCTRGLVCKSLATRTHTSIQVQRKQSGLPCAMGYGLFRALLGDRLSCHHHPRDAKHHRELDASIGASGPHDFAVRLSAVRQERLRVHRIPPHVRDDRETPLVWDGIEENKPVIWVGCEADYFSCDDWTGRTSLIPLNKFRDARKGRGSQDRLNTKLCASLRQPIIIVKCTVTVIRTVIRRQPVGWVEPLRNPSPRRATYDRSPKWPQSIEATPARSSA